MSLSETIKDCQLHKVTSEKVILPSSQYAIETLLTCHGAMRYDDDDDDDDDDDTFNSINNVNNILNKKDLGKETSNSLISKI